MAQTSFTWAVESNYGSFVEGQYVIPVEDINLGQQIDSYIDNGLRGASDAHDYASIPTTGGANAEVGGPLFQEILGDLLLGSMGTSSAYGTGTEYAVYDFPPSFSLQCEDRNQITPRLVHRYSGCALEALEITLSAEDVLRWNATFFGQGDTINVSFNAKEWASDESWDEEDNANWDEEYWGPTASEGGEAVEWNLMPSESPFYGYDMDVYFGAGSARENVKEITIHLERERLSHYTGPFANPDKVYVGPLGVTFDILLVHDDSQEEDRYEDKTQEEVKVTLCSGGDTLFFRSSKTDFGDSPIEKDRSEAGTLLTYHCRGLYNETDSGPCIFRLL